MNIVLIFWPIVLIAIWPVGIYFSIRSRKRRGEPVRPQPPQDAWFCEGWASGNSGWGRHANNCLMVCVTQKELWITPRFPFNLFLPFGWLGLEFRLPKSAVLRAVRQRSFLGANVVLDLAPPGESRTRTISLRLKQPDAFIEALGK